MLPLVDYALCVPSLRGARRAASVHQSSALQSDSHASRGDRRHPELTDRVTVEVGHSTVTRYSVRSPEFCCCQRMTGTQGNAELSSGTAGSKPVGSRRELPGPVHAGAHDLVSDDDDEGPGTDGGEPARALVLRHRGVPIPRSAHDLVDEVEASLAHGQAGKPRSAESSSMRVSELRRIPFTAPMR